MTYMSQHVWTCDNVQNLVKHENTKTCNVARLLCVNRPFSYRHPDMPPYTSTVSRCSLKNLPSILWNKGRVHQLIWCFALKKAPLCSSIASPEDSWHQADQVSKHPCRYRMSKKVRNALPPFSSILHMYTWQHLTALDSTWWALQQSAPSVKACRQARIRFPPCFWRKKRLKSASDHRIPQAIDLVGKKFMAARKDTSE